MAVVLLRHKGRIFVARRSEALLNGLYVFYLLENHDAPSDIHKNLKARGIHPISLAQIGQARHVFTHRVWHMTVYLADVQSDQTPCDGLWVDADEMDALPFPTAMKTAKTLAKDCLKIG